MREKGIVKNKAQIDGYMPSVVRWWSSPQKPSTTKFNPDILLPKEGSYMCDPNRDWRWIKSLVLREKMMA